MSPSTSASDRVGRLTTWVGSTMYENQHGKTLVNPRGNPSYKLPGITSCLSGSENLCKQSASEGFNSLENRQHLSCNIHKPEERHTLNSVVQFSLGNLGVVSSTPTNNPSRAPTGQSKLGSRLRIQNDERSVRLDDKSKGVPANLSVPRSTPNRPVCVSFDKTITSLLQLETGPESRSGKCLYSELGPSKGICQSPMVPDLLVSEPNNTTRSKSTASDTTQSCSSHHGTPKPTAVTTHCFQNGLVGPSRGIEIPLLDLMWSISWQSFMQKDINTGP